MQKVVPMYDHLAVNTESVNVTFHTAQVTVIKKENW